MGGIAHRPAFLASVRALFALLVGLSLLSLSACNHDTPSAPEATESTGEAVTVTVVSVAVSPPVASIPATVMQPFKATATLSNGKKKALTTGVTWTVSNPAVARVDTTGLVTALAAGTATVKATDTASGFSGTAALTVTAATIVSVSVTPVNKIIPISTSISFKATGTFSDGTKFPLAGAVTWSSSSASVATVDATGKATGLAAGTVSITAKHTASGVSGKTSLTVGTASLVSVAVTPAIKSVPRGLTVGYVATGTYSDGSTMDLTTAATWASSSVAIASISNAAGTGGVATAASAGKTTISATVAGKKGTAKLTVTAAVLSSIAVSPATRSVPLGDSQQLTAIGTYSDHTTQDLTVAATWTSSSPGVFVSDAVGSDGLVTVTPGAPLGNATIRATDPATGVSGTAIITVTSAVLRSLTITPPTANVPLGFTQQLTASGTFSDATTRDMTAAVTWMTLAPAVASISNDPASAGLATSLAVGSSGVSALDPTSGITASATLNVTAAVLTSLSISPPIASIANGLTQQFAATGAYSDGSHADLTSVVTWSVPGGSASVSNAAGSAGLATSNGVGTSTVRIVDPMMGLAATATLNVTAAVVVSIDVTPALQSIPLGTTQQFAATGTFTDHTTQDLTASVTWSASNADATVSNVAGSNGLATAAAVGPTTVTAIYAPAGISGATTLTVTAAALVSIAITPPSPSLPVGFAQQLTATGTYTDSTTQDLTNTATWGSSATNLFSVSSGGLGTAVSPGPATVSATDPTTGIAGTTTVTVTQAILVSLAITPGTSTLPLGTSEQLSATGTYSDKSKQDLTSTVTWSLPGPAAAVSNSGFVSALSVGTATATAIDPISGISASATVSVTAAVLVSVSVTPAVQSVPRGLTQQFVATGKYTDGSTQDLTVSATWSSSGPSATISNAAGSDGLATAAALGTATITAIEPTTGIQGTAILTTTAAALVSISVTPPSPSIPNGLTNQLTAIGLYTDGSSLDLTSAVLWASSAPSFVSVSNATPGAGLATAVGLGASTVTATDPTTGIVGNASVTVTAAIVTSLSVTPVTASLLTGQTQQLTATATMSDGTTADHTSAVTWASSAGSVYVAQNGLITGVSVGSATITATDPAVAVTASATVAVSLNTSDSAAQEFSRYVNPVGNWSFGAMRPNPFELATQNGPDGSGNDAWTDPGNAQILHNATNAYTYGGYGPYDYVSGFGAYHVYYDYASYLPPGALALQPYAEAADARWSAPSSGVYTISATFTGESYSAWGPGSCLVWDECCTPHCHGCGIGQCWCGDNYCDAGSYFPCNYRYVSCNTVVSQYTTTDVSVLQNGAPIFANYINLNGAGNQQTFTTTVALQAGDTIDFAVGNGNGTPYGVDGRYADTTLLSAQITGGATCASASQPGPGSLVGLTLSPPAANVTGAGTTPFHALAYYSNQPRTAVDVTSQVVWTASGSDLTVDAGGNVSYSGTNMTTGSVGAVFGGLSASAAVRVWDPARVGAMTGLTVTPVPTGNTAHGACYPVSATVTYADSTTEDVTATTLWGGGEPVLFGNLLVINSDFSDNYTTLTATLGAGFPSATQTYGVWGARFALTCADARIPGAAWKVSVGGSGSTLDVGQSVLPSASAYFADGSLRDVSASVQWLSCSKPTLDVSSDGWMTGLATGSAGVLAAFGTVGGSLNVNVAPAPVLGNLTSLAIQPSAINFPLGAIAPLRAIATYDNLPGYLANVTPQVTWSWTGSVEGGPPSSASLTMTGLGVGTAVFRSKLGGLTAAQHVRVWDPARLAQLSATTIHVPNENPACTPEQVTLTASFSDSTTEDVTWSTQWSPLGDSGYGILSQQGNFTPEGARQSYVYVTGSLGRGIYTPQSAPIGIWGACPAPTCSDGMKDGYETDVDCGGTTCTACGSALACGIDSDCQSGACNGGACSSTCTDGIKDGAETDVDCGGAQCSPCASGKSCVTSADCQGGLVCNAAQVCR